MLNKIKVTIDELFDILLIVKYPIKLPIQLNKIAIGAAMAIHINPSIAKNNSPNVKMLKLIKAIFHASILLSFFLEPYKITGKAPIKNGVSINKAMP
ncbi:hypothetical protein D3C85_1146260 [compost metagenome]